MYAWFFPKRSLIVALLWLTKSKVRTENLDHGCNVIQYCTQRRTTVVPPFLLSLSLSLSLSHHSFVNVACTHALYIAVHARPMWEVCCCLLSHTVVRCFFIFINTSASQYRAARKGRELWCQRSVYRSLFNFSFYGGNTDASEVANLSLWNILYAN